MAKFCTNCGAPLADDKKFCTECGTSIDLAPHGNTTPTNTSGNTFTETSSTDSISRTNTIPNTYGLETVPPHGSKYEPISTWGYIGIFLLTCIPIVGLIFTIIWAFGGCRKINKRNMARASLILTLIGLIFVAIIGFAVKSFIDNVTESIQQQLGITDMGGNTNILGGLLGGSINLDDLGNLEGLLGGLTDNNDNSSGNNTGNLDDVFDTIDDINQDAESKNNGWPASLRKYPGGTANAASSYRTEISGTTSDEMKSWIEELRSDGFTYQDFYEMGISEQDMLSVNAWWATDGKIYLSISYNEGTVTVDHMNELPDMSDLLG